MSASAISGETASGTATFVATAAQCTPAVPCAATPAPTRPPTSECVVDTGRPVRVAMTSHPIAPTATAPKKAVLGGAARRPLPENTATRPWEAKAAATPPATVHAVPQNSARRRLVTPDPTSVATPLDTSFAPFGNREHRLIRRPRELRHRVRAHLVRLVAGEEVALLVYERLPRAEVDGAMPLVDAAGRLLVLEALHRDRKERVSLDVLPIGLLQYRKPVPPGPLAPAQELRLRGPPH